MVVLPDISELPATVSLQPGAEQPIPTLSAEPSTNNACVSVSPSTRKSLGLPGSLITTPLVFKRI